MATRWDISKLGELVSFQTGKLDSNAATPAGAYPFFTCSQETLRTDTFSFDAECVLLAGNNAAGVYPLKYFRGRFDAYQRTYVIRSLEEGRLLNRFLYFALRLQLEHLKTLSTGVATKFLTLTILKNLALQVPPVHAQRRIVGVLSAYDDLIENNTRRIQLLERMAQAIYREWFVHFRFPGHEKVKLVDSPMGKVPQGWSVQRLDHVAQVNASSVRLGREPERVSYVDISSVSAGRIEKVESMPFAEAPGRARRLVRHGDTIWSCVRPNRKSYSLILDPPADLIVSTGFAVLTPRSAPFSFLHLAVTTDAFVAYLSNHATGAAYPAVTAKDFEAAGLLVADQSLLQSFHLLCEPMLVSKENLVRRNAILRRTRDLLLPKLVSGEIPV